MDTPIRNMRIRFYGVQGSSSIYPARRELDAYIEMADLHLLKQVFADVANHIDADNRLDCTLEELIGGDIDKKSVLLEYKRRFTIPPLRDYGGRTTCIHIETGDGYDIVLDCGSGFNRCTRAIEMKWGGAEERHLYIFGSHSHFDHISGFDQASVCFDPRNTIHIYGNYQYLYSLDNYLGIFSQFVRDEVLALYTPISYRKMPAKFIGMEIKKPENSDPGDNASKMPRAIHDINQPIDIGATRITAFEVYHASPCLAYKIEHGGKKFIFCTDHEWRHGPDPKDPKQVASERAEARLIGHATGADAVYRDGQFLRTEYDGMAGIGSTHPIPRIDWGHSCIEDVKKMAYKCRIKQTFIGHHDPNREWSERNWIDEALARDCADREEKVELARMGTVIDL
jgi:hypothetical protein